MIPKPLNMEKCDLYVRALRGDVTYRRVDEYLRGAERVNAGLSRRPHPRKELSEMKPGVSIDRAVRIFLSQIGEGSKFTLGDIHGWIVDNAPRIAGSRRSVSNILVSRRRSFGIRRIKDGTWFFDRFPDGDRA